MPITVAAYTKLNDNIRSQLITIYDSSPEFGCGADAVEEIEQMFEQQTQIYCAEFNDKIIGAVWSIKQPDHARLLQYIAIHPANRGRGVAERLVDQTCQQEKQLGATHFIPGCGAIARCLAHVGQA